MSTHAAVGRYETQDGRYVHFDGSPKNLGIALIDLIVRDGVGEVIDVLYEREKAWSFIDPDMPGALEHQGLGGPKMEAVEGYGAAIRDGDSTSAISVQNDRADKPWMYMIAGDGDIFVYRGRSRIGVVNAFSADAKVAMRVVEDFQEEQ